MQMWFSQYHTVNVKLDVRIQEQLFSGQSDYQKIDESFAFTRTYDRTVKYSSSDKSTSKVYYTVNGGTTKYYRERDLTFVAAGQEKLEIKDENIKSNRLTFHCDTSQQPDSITYTRGAKQSTGTTQE